MTDRLIIFDTTLRDGAQQEGLAFSVADKLAVVRVQLGDIVAGTAGQRDAVGAGAVAAHIAALRTGPPPLSAASAARAAGRWRRRGGPSRPPLRLCARCP